MENNEKKNNKGLIILVVILSLIVLGLGGWMIYDKFYGNGVKPNDNNIQVSEYKGLSIINTDNYENTFSCKNKCNEINDNVVFKTEWSLVDILNTYNKRYILYKDGYYNVRIYDVKDNVTYKFDFNIFNAKELNVDKNDNLLGILYYETESDNYTKEQYYSFANGEKISFDNYEYVTLLSKNYITFQDSSDENTTINGYIYDLNTKKIVLTEYNVVDDNDSYVRRFEKYGDDYIILNNMCQATCSDETSRIYTNDLKLITSEFNDITLDENGNLIILENNVLYTYDKKGNKIKEDSSYSEILSINREYVLDLNDNKIFLYYKGNKLKDMVILDTNEKILDSFVEGNKAVVYVKSSKVTLDDIWNDYNKFDSYEQYPFEAKSKSELKSYLKTSDCENAYLYEYNFETKELTKLAIADCGEW